MEFGRNTAGAQAPRFRPAPSVVFSSRAAPGAIRPGRNRHSACMLLKQLQAQRLVGSALAVVVVAAVLAAQLLPWFLP